MSLVMLNHRGNIRVRVYRQPGPSDIGPWCVVIGPKSYGASVHIARHTCKRSAQAHAARIRKAIG